MLEDRISNGFCQRFTQCHSLSISKFYLRGNLINSYGQRCNFLLMEYGSNNGQCNG